MIEIVKFGSRKPWIEDLLVIFKFFEHFVHYLFRIALRGRIGYLNICTEFYSVTCVIFRSRFYEKDGAYNPSNHDNREDRYYDSSFHLYLPFAFNSFDKDTRYHRVGHSRKDAYYFHVRQIGHYCPTVDYLNSY